MAARQGDACVRDGLVFGIAVFEKLRSGSAQNKLTVKEYCLRGPCLVTSHLEKGDKLPSIQKSKMKTRMVDSLISETIAARFVSDMSMKASVLPPRDRPKLHNALESLLGPYLCLYTPKP